jgi:hypothetical protein
MSSMALALPFPGNPGKKWAAKFLLVLVLSVSLVSMGCAVGGAATWINMGLNLITTLLPTIPSLIAAISGLVGKNVLTQAQVDKLTQVFTGVQQLFQQAQTALTQYEANSDPTLITKIQDILNQVKTSLSNVLTDVQITDPATVAKITLIVNSFIDLANNILAILPTVTNGKVTARKVTHGQMAQVTPEAWAARFNEAVQKPSGNTALDAAFSQVHAVPAHAR